MKFAWLHGGLIGKNRTTRCNNGIVEQKTFGSSVRDLDL